VSARCEEFVRIVREKTNNRWSESELAMFFNSKPAEFDDLQMETLVEHGINIHKLGDEFQAGTLTPYQYQLGIAAENEALREQE
jgi:hypothetical protein